MIQLRELDDHTAALDQLHSDVDGPVVLINTFTVPADTADDFVAVWASDRTYMSTQPGFISASLHGGIGGSSAFVAVAEWATLGNLRDVLTSPDFRARMGAYPDGTTAAPHVFQKVRLDPS